MIILVNLNDSAAETVQQFCKLHNLSSQSVLSALMRESVSALAEERELRVDNILNPVGIAADLLRASMSVDEFAEFCATGVNIDTLEANFLRNCERLAAEPELMEARKFVASLFTGDVDFDSVPDYDKPQTEDETYIVQLGDVLRASPGEKLMFKEIVERSGLEVPRNASLKFAEYAASNRILSEKEKRVNVYWFEAAK